MPLPDGRPSRNREEIPAGLSPSPVPDAQTADVTLPSGEKVSGELKVLNTYDVTLVSGGKTLTWPAELVKVDVHDPLAPHRALLPKYKDDDIHNMFAYLWTLQ